METTVHLNLNRPKNSQNVNVCVGFAKELGVGTSSATTAIARDVIIAITEMTLRCFWRRFWRWRTIRGRVRRRGDNIGSMKCVLENVVAKARRQ